MNRHRTTTRRILLAALGMAVTVCSKAQIEVLFPSEPMEVEYFVDNDPGLGCAFSQTLTPDENGIISFDAVNLHIELTSNELSVPREKPSDHLIGVRTMKTIGGVTYFGPTITTMCHFPPSQELQLQTLEYFWDEDPGLGQGSLVEIPETEELDWENLPISTEGLSEGGHMLGMRLRSTPHTLGNSTSYVSVYFYGPTVTYPVFVRPSTSGIKLHLIEYFWDEDPGIGEGSFLYIGTGDECEYSGNFFSTEGLSGGLHLFGLRILIGSNAYGPTFTYWVMVPPPGDLNRDGRVSLSDVTAIVDLVSGLDEAEPHRYDRKAADVNNDDVINLSDINELVKKILTNAGEE